MISVTQLCLILCDPMDCSLPGSSVYGIIPAKILELVAISSSRESSWPKDPTCISYSPCIGRWILYHWATWEALERSVKMKSLIHVLLFATPWTIACQAPLSMGFSRQEYWSHFLLQGIFLTEGSNPGLQADSLPSESPGKSLVTFNLWQLFSLFIFYNFNIFWRHKHAIL